MLAAQKWTQGNFYHPRLKNNNFLRKTPRLVKKLHFNCWGATLAYFGVIKDPYWVHPMDMNLWINTHTKPVKRLQVNDIAVFRQGETLIHTAIYFGNRKWWHKEGELETHSKTLREIKAMYPAQVSFVRLVKK